MRKTLPSLVLEPLKDNALEKQHAAAFMEWINFNKTYKDVFHVPNGQFREKMVAYQLKKEGVKPGVSDFIWPHARGPWHHLYIELKRKNGKLSGSQYKWRKRMLEAGNCYVVAFGWEQAANVLCWYNALGVFMPELGAQERAELQAQIDDSTGATAQLKQMAETKERKHKEYLAAGKPRS